MKDVRVKIFYYIDLFNFYCGQIMGNLCQKCKKKWGVTHFVLEIKRAEKYLEFENWHKNSNIVLRGFQL